MNFSSFRLSFSLVEIMSRCRLHLHFPVQQGFPLPLLHHPRALSYVDFLSGMTKDGFLKLIAINRLPCQDNSSIKNPLLKQVSGGGLGLVGVKGVVGVRGWWGGGGLGLVGCRSGGSLGWWGQEVVGV